jgi:hypothetical protein
MSELKVGFVLASPSREALASTRISVLNMLPMLRAEGLDTSIVYEPRESTETPDLGELAPSLIGRGFQIVYFQKVYGPSVLKQARELRRAGIKTVYGVCDLVESTMVEATDATITVTEFLKSTYPIALHHKIFVVHDGIERPEICKQAWTTHAGSRAQPLRAIMITSHALRTLPLIEMPPPWLNVTIVGRYPPLTARMQRMRDLLWTLRTMRPSHRSRYLAFILSRRIGTVGWTADGVYDEMLRADIGIIPINTESSNSDAGALPGWELKSENRLTLMMSAGLPVVASAIPSYEHVIDQQQNAFLARSRRQFIDHLEALRDPALRREMGRRARIAVLETYSMQRQASLLINVLRNVARETC